MPPRWLEPALGLVRVMPRQPRRPQAAQAAQGAQAAAPGAGAAGAAGGAGSRTGSGAAGTGSKDQKKGGFGVGLAIAAAIAVLGAVGYGLYSMDFFGSGDSAASTTPTPTEPAIVTQYVTETQATTIVETAHSNPDDAAVDEGDGDEAGDPAEPASQRRNDAARDKDKDNPARSTAHARAHGDTARTGAGNNDANSGDTNRRAAATNPPARTTVPAKAPEQPDTAAQKTPPVPWSPGRRMQ